jgi:cation transport ATPase
MGAWAAGTLPILAVLFVEIVTSLRRSEVGLDLVAALSMTAALAFGEPLAGNVVALMYAGGQFLESYAERRAGREMTALLGRVARTAMRYVGLRIQAASPAEFGKLTAVETEKWAKVIKYNCHPRIPHPCGGQWRMPSYRSIRNWTPSPSPR